MGTLYCQQAPSFGWDIKPRSWLSVVIKNPMALLVKSRGVTLVSGQIPTTGPCQSWPPNNPHPLDWLYLSLSSPPVAGVWWAHWRLCPVAAVASSKWMLHTGGGWGETPPHDCKALWVYNNTQKALYKCIIIHSFSLKTALLLALASVKRVGDLQALSVNLAHLEFGPNDPKVVLKPRLGYLPKVLSTLFRARVIVLSALNPPPPPRMAARNPCSSPSGPWKYTLSVLPCTESQNSFFWLR